MNNRRLADILLERCRMAGNPLKASDVNFAASIIQLCATEVECYDNADDIGLVPKMLWDTAEVLSREGTKLGGL